MKLSYILDKSKSIWSFIYKYRTAVLFISVLILLYIVIFRKPHEVIAISPQNQDLIHQVKVLKDANDKYLAQINQKVVSEAEAKLRADSLAKALKIKPKFIKGEDKYVTKLDTFYSVVTSPVYLPTGDTAYKAEKHDGYVDIVAIAGKSSGSISYLAIDTITRVEIRKNPLIGRPETLITLRNANPANKIVEGYSWRVKEKTPWLTIGPYGGYDIFSQKPSFGVSVQIPIIKLYK